MRPDGVFKGFAHIDFADLASAIKAYEAHNDQPLYLIGRAIKLDYAPRRELPPPEPYHKLYVADFTKGEPALRKVFDGYEDKIIDVHMCMFVLSHNFRMLN
jgi:RNA recognition motif-containing protein